MAKVTVNESTLGAIAEAIRTKGGTQTTYRPNQMPSAISALPSAAVVQTKSITENGTYTPSPGVDGFSQVNVNVPQGITPTGNINITDTQVTDVTNYATAQVVDADLVAGNIKKDVDILGVVGTYEGSGGGSTLVTKTITQNGTYDPADDSADGYSQVTVNVSGGGGSSGVYVGTEDPTASIGSDGDYYYKRESQPDGQGWNLTSWAGTTSQTQAGWEFKTLTEITVTGLCAFTTSTGAVDVYLCDTSGTIIAQVTGQISTANAWGQFALDNPVTLQANTNYVVLCNRGTAGSLRYTQTASRETDSRISYVRGRYGTSYPGTAENSSRYSADILIAGDGLYRVKAEYHKSNGVWSQI